LAEDILDYAVVLAEIADAYFERAEAKPIYEQLGADPTVCNSEYVFLKIWHSSRLKTSSIYIPLQTAACMKMLEELAKLQKSTNTV
jgi:general transcription factor 3C polypeptide 3 (transcription factor C subunit 4)